MPEAGPVVLREVKLRTRSGLLKGAHLHGGAPAFSRP